MHVDIQSKMNSITTFDQLRPGEVFAILPTSCLPLSPAYVYIVTNFDVRLNNIVNCIRLSDGTIGWILPDRKVIKCLELPRVKVSFDI